MSDSAPVTRPSGLPYPAAAPEHRDQLPDRGLPGAPAAWGLRAAARILDVLVFSMVFSVVVSIFGTDFDEQGELIGPGWPLLLQPVCFILYETVLLSMFGQTLGKWVCQVKAVSWFDGALAEPKQTFVRAFVPGVFALVAAAAPLVGIPVLGWLLLVPPVIYLSSIANEIYRGPHDRAAGTIVLAAPRYRTPRD